jgi:ApbE superfamily uncharacterized protein (UPF0280 family)
MSTTKPDDPDDLNRFVLEYKNTSINVLCDCNLASEACCFLEEEYNELEAYCQRQPFFLVSLQPVSLTDHAPPIARLMASASEIAGVGPMAAVAGAFAELLGRFLLAEGASEVVVDNGGDIFLKLDTCRMIRVYAGNSSFSDRIGLKILPENTPLGVCTSSASVGPSISFGDSDAVCVVAKSASLADAAATAVGNAVKGHGGISCGIQKAKEIAGIDGVLIVRGKALGAWGNLPEVMRL